MNSMISSHRLTLGTAQFGFKYGAFNKQGQLPFAEVTQILDYAKSVGITLLDTARGYGESEKVIGRYVQPGNEPFKIISKVSKHLPVDKLIAESLTDLGMSSLYGLLIHNFELFKDDPSVFEKLVELKHRGQVQKIGFSLYHPHELEQLIESRTVFDLLQVQYSIFDQRFAPFFPALHESGVEIHTRSVFLQGLYFADSQTLSPHFDLVKSKIDRVHELSRQAGIPVGALCLNYAMANKLIDQVIIGVDSIKNLQDNIEYLKLHETVLPLLKDLDVLHVEDINILFPHYWK